MKVFHMSKPCVYGLCSLIWLKLRIKSLGLKKRNAYVGDSTVKVVIAKELGTSHQLCGYHAMWRHISQKYKLDVKRFFIFSEIIASICVLLNQGNCHETLNELEPEGVATRKSKYLKRRVYYNKVYYCSAFQHVRMKLYLYNIKGPNYVWHMGGYDKLSPYGLAVHGCIDG